MAWGPQGKTSYERLPRSREELVLLASENPRMAADGLQAFIDTIKDGDDVYFEAERNNHTGYERYVGRRKGFTYCYVALSFMS